MNASARHTKNFPIGIFSLDTSLNNLENPDREIYLVQKQVLAHNYPNRKLNRP